MNKQTHFFKLLSIIFIISILSVSNLFSQPNKFRVAINVASLKTETSLPNANIRINPNNINGFTNKEGLFITHLPIGTYQITISHIGYKSIFSEIQVSNDMVFNFLIEEDIIRLGEGVTVTSSRSLISRSNLETPTPIDVFYAEDFGTSGTVEINQLITQYIPSYNSQRQTFSDGTDHIDPASLRGMGPDQVLVLINGKRRHTTSLVNTTPIVGKGSVGTDMNAIPVAAIERIEVLRDGASAQYGSDAIAGVINIILKSGTNSDIYFQGGQTMENDGEYVYFGSNFGTNLGDKGFINFTAEMRHREPTNRAREYQGLVYRTADQDGLSFEENLALDNEQIASYGRTRKDYNLVIGNSKQTNASVFLNSAYKFDNSELYALGGFSYRNSLAPGFYRFPNDEKRNNTEIYPHGFLPYLRGSIFDKSLAVGLRGHIGEWNYDLSNTFGGNTYNFYVDNSLNRSWGLETPLNFYAGSLEFEQNTTNFDIRRNYGDIIGTETFIVSVGTEFRVENFAIKEGEEASWSSRDEEYEPGSQVFPGFRPENAVDAYRHSAAAYLDIESDITKEFLVSAAGRLESYSDFGNSLTGKLAARYNVLDMFSLRGSYGTGFRAPSLHQQYFESVGTFFFNTDFGLLPFNIATLNNQNRVTKALGFGKLKAETSTNISFGITSRITENTFLTIDAYQIDVKDRIVLSSYFTRFDPAVAELIGDLSYADGFQVFSNAIDTRTKGIEVTISNELNLGTSTLGIILAANISETKVVGNIKVPDTFTEEHLANILFNREERSRIESGSPKTRVNLTLNYKLGGLEVLLRNNYYGDVTYLDADYPALDQNYEGKILTDLALSYNLTDKVKFTLGGNNILDVYPEENKTDLQDWGRFPYNTKVTQFGFMGAYYYAGFNIRL